MSVEMPGFIRVLCILCASVVNTSSAAPPAVTSLSPAGGQRGTVVEVTVNGTFDKWPIHVWSSGPGLPATATKEKGKIAVAVGPSVVPGVHWLRFYDDTGASGLRPFIVGTLPEVMEKEPNDSPATAQPITGNAVVNGKLEKMGDVDCYAVTLKKGQTLVASLEAHHSLRSPMDAVLQVVTPSGTILAQNNDYHGLDPFIAFPAPGDGTYIVRLFAFPSNPDSSIKFFGSDVCVYRLTLTTDGFAEYPMPLAVKASGEFALRGWNQNANARPGIVLDGFAPVWHPNAANPLRVRVENHDCFDSTITGPLPLVLPPISITGQLSQSNQVNVHPIALKKGSPLSIAVESASFGLPVVPVVRILDPAGKQLSKIEPKQLHEDASQTFVPTTDGTYGIEVRDLHGAASPRHVYLVRVTPFATESQLTTTTDRFTLVPGTPLDVPIAFDLKALLASGPPYRAEGLPRGVTAEFVTPAKKDAKGLTLRLTAEPMTWSGPFRLVARDASNNRVRAIHAPNGDFAHTTADFWLTVGATATPAPPEKPKKKE